MRHKSALKATRQAKRHAILNLRVKKSIRQAVRAVIDAAKAKDVKKVAELTAIASATLDKAAKHGTIHWKSAARKKSRLAQQVQKLNAPAAAPAPVAA